MKANTMVASPAAAAAARFGTFAAIHGIAKASGGRIAKPSSSSSSNSSSSEAEEMVACFSLLKTLVPSVRPSENISKTELLQRVIDYISESSATLEEANREEEEEDVDEQFGDENTDPAPSASALISDAESEVSN